MTRAPTGFRLRPRRALVQMVRRVRAYLPSLLLAAAAAGIAYLLALLVFSSQHAMFAPIAAIVSTGLTAGQRLLRAIEITAGVVLGLILADVLVGFVGLGAWQLSLAVFLAMTGAVAFRASPLMANQAAVAAVIVVALAPYQQAPPQVRLFDAMIGGAVAIVLNAFLSPDPQKVAADRTRDTLEEVSSALHLMVRALETTDIRPATEAQTKLNELDGARALIEEALLAVGERLQLSRGRRRLSERRRLRAVYQVVERLDLLLTTARSMARATASTVRHGEAPDGRIVTAVDQYARAIGDLRRWVGGQTSGEVVREHALRAAATASSTLTVTQRPTSNVMVWQVRSAAVDLLRMTGLSHRDAIRSLEGFAGRTDRIRIRPRQEADTEDAGETVTGDGATVAAGAEVVPATEGGVLQAVEDTAVEDTTVADAAVAVPIRRPQDTEEDAPPDAPDQQRRPGLP
ncbi:uncharacterized membrane protein YgaE (UPF0421/DUF939 family) [Ornithinicoccus hortensis]|uniref:Uncharacterized membrane protein YgaE (UPF0421/DUF939 family) n=2 Tax=Ornithinicoccus hortensis TaxID=82346 RepID=A0A542YPM5_9MICO|nr:uncharacterized membrane protein YgaE (UPF0421/DUF939 family) [Ornithinicoccus hortensis]